MARLRGPGGCPWDREQTHQTLAHPLLEETHELLEAIDSGDSDAIRDELGDLLLQVVFHAEMAAEDGRWDVDDVAPVDAGVPSEVRLAGGTKLVESGEQSEVIAADTLGGKAVRQQRLRPGVGAAQEPRRPSRDSSQC